VREIVASLIPALIFVGTLLFLAGILYWHNSRRRKHRSPLTRQLLRGPGQSLSVYIEELSIKIETYAISIATIPLFLYSSYISAHYYGVAKQGGHAGIIYAFMTTGIIILLAVKMRRLLKERQAMRLGLDCEMAVGQELNRLMQEGYNVYHDMPAENFNIDHVVVGPNGVFAIETKGRAKPNRGQGSIDATVEFDGQSLKFPEWIDTNFLHQARRQAAWLSKWLTSATAEQVAVYAVLALPGWFIKRKKRSDVLLLNGKDYHFIIKQRTDTPLSEGLIQRICHQLEQQCRDVEPKTYNTKRTWPAPSKAKVA